jgi:hypothetical protein
MTDFSYWAAERHAVASVVAPPLERPEDVPLATAEADRPSPTQPNHRHGLARRAVGIALAFRRSTLLTWANRIIRLPIGERFALISVTAAIASPRVTFIALLAWGGVAAVYSLVVRLLLAYSVPRRLVRAVLR